MRFRLLLLSIAAAFTMQARLTIATYNILEGMDTVPQRSAIFHAWVDSVKPDILMINELVGFTPAKLDSLARACGFPYSSLLKEEWYPVGVVSKTPIETVNRIVTPMSVVLGQKKGLWHGLLHARTAGIDLLVTHLSPFDYKFRRQEAGIITHYADSLGLTDYLVAGDLNSISPYDADCMAAKPKYIKHLKAGDAKRPDWNNLRPDGNFDTSVVAAFLASGLEDPLYQFERDPRRRMTHPSAYSRKVKPGDPSIEKISHRIDYILLSPSLMGRCTGARVDRVEGVSDHYPVVITLKDEDYRNASLPAERRAQILLGQMNVWEKVAQIRHLHSGDLFTDGAFNKANIEKIAPGVAYGFVEGFPLSAAQFRTAMREVQEHMVNHTRLGIPAFIVAEALHGSVHEGSTIFPQNIALASTFNPSLAYERARAVCPDLHYQRVNQILAPCVDVARDLRWGRVEESYGEDPHLASMLAYNEAKGYLDGGIQPMLKHFGAHGNPSGGLNLAGVNCGLGELHDVYLAPFKKVITSLPVQAVMSAYNCWNGEPNSSSHYLLTEVLRNQYGFQGYVYSDWGTIDMLRYFHGTASSKADAARQALMAGLDAEASSDCYPAIPELITNNQLPAEALDRAVYRVLLAKFRAGLFEDPYGERFASAQLRSPESVEVSRRIADESTVLLKNEGHLLPLDPTHLKSVAVIGPNADQVQFGDYSWSRSNKDGITPLQGIRELLGPTVTVNYAKGCEIMTPDTTLIAEAVRAAAGSDVAIIFAGSASASLARDYSGSNCGEGFDTATLELSGAQPELIRRIVATGTPTVLVLVTGKAYAINWEKEHVPAILVQWYAGQSEGASIADILFGRVNPSGHLPVSFAQSAGHLPAYYNHLGGDRGYYHAPGVRDYVFTSPAPLYAFGHGLSYTDFKISDLTFTPGKDTLDVKVTVTNTGSVAGKAVPQLYTRNPAGARALPVKELRNFAKISLNLGESRVVDLSIPYDALAYTDNSGQRHLDDGDYTLMAGFASDNLPLSTVYTRGSVGPRHAAAQPDGTATDGTDSNFKGTGKKIQVKGTARDVQATPMGSLRIISAKLKKQVGTTRADGTFSVRVPDNDTLTFTDGTRTATIPVAGNSTLNPRL